jgi:phosphoribosylformimino-5-aminoimidazole carboxamide ribotide isomerase
MIAWPAVDLRGGRVVQLVGGDPDCERVRLADPVSVARHWVACGFRALHLVDLDAALGQGDNRALLGRVAAAVPVPVQAGGGVRDDHAVNALLEAGATRVLIGTRAIEDPAWLRAMAATRPGRLIVAADVRAGFVVIRGWTASTTLTLDAALASLDDLPLAGVLVTDVTREGRLEGIDAAAFRAAVQATRHPLIAAGGITSADDLRALEAAGAAGAVLGMALYTGRLDATQVAKEFAS